MSDLYEYQDEQILSIINRQRHQEIRIGFQEPTGECKANFAGPHAISGEVINHNNISQHILRCNCGCGLIQISELRRDVLKDDKRGGVIFHTKAEWAIAVYASPGFKDAPVHAKKSFRRRYPSNEMGDYQRQKKAHLELYGSLIVDEYSKK